MNEVRILTFLAFYFLSSDWNSHSRVSERWRRELPVEPQLRCHHNRFSHQHDDRRSRQHHHAELCAHLPDSASIRAGRVCGMLHLHFLLGMCMRSLVLSSITGQRTRFRRRILDSYIFLYFLLHKLLITPHLYVHFASMKQYCLLTL